MSEKSSNRRNILLLQFILAWPELNKKKEEEIEDSCVYNGHYVCRPRVQQTLCGAIYN
jgi:hypothetical protein